MAWANWQRAGRKNAPRPKPLSPNAKPKGQIRYGGTDRSSDEVKALLARYGPAPAASNGQLTAGRGSG